MNKTIYIYEVELKKIKKSKINYFYECAIKRSTKLAFKCINNDSLLIDNEYQITIKDISSKDILCYRLSPRIIFVVVND